MINSVTHKNLLDFRDLTNRLKYNDHFFLLISNLFVGLFLISFQPFKLGEDSTLNILVLLALIFPIFTLSFLFLKTKKLINPFIKTLTIIIITGSFSKLIHWQLGFSSMSFFKFAYWLYGSTLTLSIPFIIRVFIQNLSALPTKTQKEVSTKAFKNVDALPFLSQLNTVNFLFAKAFENYISIHWLHNNNLKKELIRYPIGKLESLINNENILRCHRSYIINCEKVKCISGNKRGYKAVFAHCTKTKIPVSPQRIDIIQSKI